MSEVCNNNLHSTGTLVEGTAAAAKAGILPLHFGKGLFSNSINVWVQVSHVLAAVHRNRVIPVEGQLFVGVDGDQDDAAVGVDRLVLDEPHSQVVQDGRFVKIGLEK